MQYSQQFVIVNILNSLIYTMTGRFTQGFHGMNNSKNLLFYDCNANRQNLYLLSGPTEFSAVCPPSQTLFMIHFRFILQLCLALICKETHLLIVGVISRTQALVESGDLNHCGG